MTCKIRQRKSLLLTMNFVKQVLNFETKTTAQCIKMAYFSRFYMTGVLVVNQMEECTGAPAPEQPFGIGSSMKLIFLFLAELFHNSNKILYRPKW